MAKITKEPVKVYVVISNTYHYGDKIEGIYLSRLDTSNKLWEVEKERR